jgi:AcrR family transcriptional regulator
MAGKAAPLRERKRQRTRAAIVAAAVKLFQTRGYDATTVADIAEAAEIAPRTFFSYFASKDAVLFPDVDARVAAAADAVAARRPEDRPADILLRALSALLEAGDDDLVGDKGDLRMRLIQTHPAVRGRALQLQLDAQRDIASLLLRAFPDELDPVTAGAVVGAFVGAVTGAVQATIDTEAPNTPEARSAALQRATEIALRPWQGARDRQL